MGELTLAEQDPTDTVGGMLDSGRIDSGLSREATRVQPPASALTALRVETQAELAHQLTVPIPGARDHVNDEVPNLVSDLTRGEALKHRHLK